MRLGARRHEQLEVVLRRRPQPGLARARAAPRARRRAGPAGPRAGPEAGAGRAPEVADRVLLADHEPRPPRAVDAGERAAAAPRRNEVRADVAERAQPAVLGEPGEAAEPAPGDVLEEDALDRVLGAEGQDLVQRRFDQRGHAPATLGSRPMPIHVRAEPGEYGEACLLPGDPLRAKYIAETYFDNPVQRNGERGMLGYSGEWEGKPVSVQSTGMGCPSAAIVMEELVQLGVKRFLRVGTCGGLQEDLAARRPDRGGLGRPRRRDGAALRRRRAARADRRLGARPLGRPRGQGARAAAAGRRDRLQRHLLRPGSRAAQALVGPRRARRRDGGGGAVHDRRPPRGQGRLPADRERHRDRRASSRASRTTSCAPRSTA